MNNLEGFYSQYNGESAPWETDIDYLLMEVMNMLEFKYKSLDIVSQVGLFLDKEEKELKKYITNLVIHYTYKRIFNKANKYFQKYKKKYFDDEIQFKEDFQVFLKREFDVSDYQHVKKFSNKLLNAILSNERTTGKIENGRPKQSENKAMRKYAKEQGRVNCYLCGVETHNKKEKEKIHLNQWHNDYKNDFTKKLHSDVFDILKEHNINMEKSKHRTIRDDMAYHLSIHFPSIVSLWIKYFQRDKKRYTDQNNYRINRKTINKLFEVVSLNELNHEFKYAYSIYNNNIMKIEHCTSVDWGGGKSEENLLISCHKCNQKKSNTVFYTEYSINKFFINEFEPDKAKTAFTGLLGEEALISLKIKQQFKCSNCQKEFSEPGQFYLRRINDDDGYHYLNTQITCQSCLDSYNKLGDDMFFDQFIKIKE
jgi:hypothetical protein